MFWRNHMPYRWWNCCKSKWQGCQQIRLTYMYPTCKYAFFSKGMLSRLQVKARSLRKKRKKNEWLPRLNPFSTSSEGNIPTCFVLMFWPRHHEDSGLKIWQEITNTVTWRYFANDLHTFQYNICSSLPAGLRSNYKSRSWKEFIEKFVSSVPTWHLAAWWYLPLENSDLMGFCFHRDRQQHHSEGEPGKKIKWNKK